MVMFRYLQTEAYLRIHLPGVWNKSPRRPVLRPEIMLLRWPMLSGCTSSGDLCADGTGWNDILMDKTMKECLQCNNGRRWSYLPAAPSQHTGWSDGVTPVIGPVAGSSLPIQLSPMSKGVQQKPVYTLNHLSVGWWWPELGTRCRV